MAIKSISFSLVTFITLCCAVQPTVATPVFGTNLIVNGDAEAGPGSDTSYVVPVPGWTTDGYFNVVLYDTPDFLASTDPAPPDRGNNYFYGGEIGYVMTTSGASQSIDVSAGAAIIDTGGVTFDLTGWLGGWESQSDFTVLTALF